MRSSILQSVLIPSLILMSFLLKGQADFKVLVFSKTEGFRHSSITAGQQCLQDLSSANNFSCHFSENAEIFNNTALDSFAVVVFLNTTGDVLNGNQEAAFENFIESGGGYVGIHAASDTEYNWPWYGALVGSYFNGHPAIQDAEMKVENGSHPATEHLGSTWTRREEWYNFATPFPQNLSILLTVDEQTYQGGTMGDFHPIAWFHEVGLGRSFYTAMGHEAQAYSEPDFRKHILGALRWAAGLTSTVVLHEKEQALRLYPNPSNDWLTVDVPNGGNANKQLELIDLNGRVLLAKEFRSERINLNVSGLASGTYFLSVLSGGYSYKAIFIRQ